MTEAKKTDPKLWERVKEELKESDKGGEPGQWSARKAQMAVQEYKKRGGGYTDDSPDQKDTDLNDWTEEEWGTQSGAQSLGSGERYLPKKVRMLLTEEEYARTSEKKRRDTEDKGYQYSSQPDDIEAKVAKIKKDGPTKEMLDERARDLDIDGRSSMSKDELYDAIERATDARGSKKGGRANLEDMTKGELEDRARALDVEGRSRMDKGELVDAILEATERG
ncbi:MAG: Rho termination factor N-terminal domain-containing protein [Paracoccaceae bacterium]